ncbi:MAG: dTDP-glucose 4,6-dehydratase [Candidatus Peribacteraceae bacterium]|nr:dTDP-glucose 4,6-dehydratase [Candidatus Peribacteraceae bacterium]
MQTSRGFIVCFRGLFSCTPTVSCYHVLVNLLVTGAAGFIGSHFVLRHVAQHPQDSVVVLDALTYAADISFLDPVIDRITFVEGDVADAELVAKLTEKHGIEVIVNFAAETHVDRSIQNASPFLHSNVMGVQSLIDVCKAHPAVLLLHISTDEVYGERKDGEPPCGVSDPLRPGNPYAASKAAGDLMLLAAARTFGIRVRITRCTNNYGPHQDATKLLPVVIGKAFADAKIPIYGEGKQKRDWLFVTDHADAVECVLSRGTDGQVYLISADDERSNLETAKAVLDALGKPHSLIEFVPDRPGHDWRYALDSSGTRAIGWRPTVSFEQGLQRAIGWYADRRSV